MLLFDFETLATAKRKALIVLSMNASGPDGLRIFRSMQVLFGSKKNLPKGPFSQGSSRLVDYLIFQVQRMVPARSFSSLIDCEVMAGGGN